MAIHRLDVPYETSDQDALEGLLRRLDAAGQKVNSVTYFCVAPVATFLIQTTGGSALRAAKAEKPAATEVAGKGAGKTKTTERAGGKPAAG